LDIEVENVKQSIVDIKAESFPWFVKLIGGLFLFTALIVILDYWWVSIVLVTVGLTLLTGYSGTDVDPVNNTFREYNSYLFMRTGATEKYDRIERILINDEKVATHTAHPSRLYFFNSIVYNAYIKFVDGRKLFLTSRKDKAKLIKLLSQVVTVLSVDLTDNTVSGQ
jgi:hypothetical protein